MVTALIKGIAGLVLTILVFVAIYFGATYAYNSYIEQSVENWCQDNQKGDDITTDAGIFDITVTKGGGVLGIGRDDAIAKDPVTGTACNLEICTEYADDLFDTQDDLDFDNATTQDIDSQCMNVCAAWTMLVDCRCKNCPTCHDDCGLGYLARCQKYLSCGTHEYKTFDPEHYASLHGGGSTPTPV